MSKTNLLIGSLSNDLYKVACLTQRGSIKAAEVFWRQSDRWIKDLENAQVEGYIKKIIFDVKSMLNSKLLTIETAERYLMYSILLQNYVLHYKEK